MMREVKKNIDFHFYFILSKTIHFEFDEIG